MSEQKIENALAFIPAEEREVWVRMAMAVKSELGDSGFDIWDSWSQTAYNYNARSAKSVWKSCKGAGGTTIATLFHEAAACGWRDNKAFSRPTQEAMEARRRATAERLTAERIEIEHAQGEAARKAAWIMHQAKPEEHAYLQSKGWPELKGAVWWPNERQNLLCIPMRVGSTLVGVQLINREGKKRYLTGQRTSGAEYLISNNGHGAMDFWVEGYATGLSLRECLQALKLRYRIHVTFSAGNLEKMARAAGVGYVIADKDESGTGERVAIASGLPYWISDVQGEDLNDAHKRLGLFGCSQILRKWIISQK